MPRQSNYYEPDQLDCNTMVTAMCEDFGLACDIATRYERDQVVVIVTCRRFIEAPNGGAVVQAIVRAPLRTAKSLYVMQYGAILDCWHQMDRGVLGAAQTPVVRGWNGRPQRPMPHKQ